MHKVFLLQHKAIGGQIIISSIGEGTQPNLSAFSTQLTTTENIFCQVSTPDDNNGRLDWTEVLQIFNCTIFHQLIFTFNPKSSCNKPNDFNYMHFTTG